MICTTTRERLADGRDVVVKRCPYPAEVEAEGLRALAAAGGPVPGGARLPPATSWCWSTSQGRRAWAELGRAMARVHRATADAVRLAPGQPGGPVRPAERLVRRLADLLRHRTGSWRTWPTRRSRRRSPSGSGRACAGPLPDLLPQHPPASLTHGDLWFGNVVDGRWMVDPAVCYADRELDLAFMQTGGLPDELFDAYQREWPFEPGYEQRRPALQLHKMLVGLRHFGPARLPRIEAVLDHYGW